MLTIDAVIFDWGGTLTLWHDIDFHAESVALAQAVVNSEHDHVKVSGLLHRAGDREHPAKRERRSRFAAD